MTSTNYPPQQQPMTTGQGTVSRAWLRYFLALGQPQAAGGNAPAPTPGTALDFIRINSTGTAYETQTPAQVLQDIGGLSLAEAETLFEPLLDIYEIQYGTYSVVQGDTGRAIYMLGSPAIVRLSADLAQGTKIVVSAGDISGCLITGDGVSLINGVILGSVELSLGQSAACELMGDGLWSVTFGPIQGAGVPTFYAPPGVAYSRNDDVSQAIDRVYVSNGTYPYLAAQQAADGATHQYLLNETSGTVAADNIGTATAAYYSPISYNEPTQIPGLGSCVYIGNGGYVLLPLLNPPMSASGAFEVEVVYQNPLTGTAGPGNIFCNMNQDSGTGFSLYFTGGSEFVFFVQGSTSGAKVTGSISAINPDFFLLTCSFDGVNASLYINGILQGTEAISGSYVPSTTNDIALGIFSGFVSGDIGPGIYQCAALYPFVSTQYMIAKRYNCALGSPWWSDVQAFSAFGADGSSLGIANSVMAGQNIALSVSSETLQISSFMTLQQAGTIQNNDVISLNVIGYGATVTNSGQIGTINIPGISLSGTAIYDLEVGAGVGETIVSGKGTLLNTGVLALGTGTGSISLGSGLTLASNTLSASGGGGGGGGGINFGQLAAPTASQTLLVYPVGSGGLTLSSGLPGASAYAETAPTSAVALTIYKNGTSIGTINWAAGAHAGTFSFTAKATFASGDVLTVGAPGTPDLTFANFGVTLVPIGSSGAVNLVSMQTISGASSVQFTGLAAGYDYFIVGQSMTKSASCELCAQFGSGSGPTWLGDNSYYQTGVYYGSTSIFSTGPGTFFSPDFTSADTYAGQNYGNLKIEILGAVEDAVWHGADMVMQYGLSRAVASYQPSTPTAITALQIFPSAGTISGKFYLYSRER